MRRIALLCLLAPALWAGKKTQAPRAGEALRFTPTWNAAIEEACALNVPIVVHRHGFY